MAAILEATVDALAVDLDASMAEIARRAGVVRATVYMHFPTRDALIDAVTHKGIAEVTSVIEASEPHRGDPVDAVGRVVRAAWRSLARFHPLVEVNTRRANPDLQSHHAPALAVLEPLISRGQAAGAFRSDVPAGWHLAMLLALIHAASRERHRGLADAEVERALVETVVGALAARAR